MSEVINYTGEPKILGRLVSPDNRFAISRVLASAAKAHEVVLFDHPSPTEPSTTRRILGYERNLLSAIPLASAMRTHIIMQAPPFPFEMEYASQLHQTVPEREDLHVWVLDPRSGKLVDGLEIYRDDKNGYNGIVRATLESPPAGSIIFPVDATKQLIEKQGLGRTLVLPFQTRNWHHERFASLRDSGRVILPDSADQWTDKGKAHTYFEEHNIGDLRPTSVSIDMNDIREKTAENLTEAARRVEDACSTFIDTGKIPFVKLAATSSAGFGVITPSDNSLLDYTLLKEDRSTNFRMLVKNILNRANGIPNAVIEEYVKPEEDETGKKEYVLEGIIIGGEFHPSSVLRTINSEKGVYQGAIVSPYVGDIGLTETSVLQALGEGNRMAAAMSEGGYTTGYMSKDFIVTHKIDGRERHAYHDDNDRRGGSLVAVNVASLEYQGYCSRSVTVNIPSNRDRSTYLLVLNRNLQDVGTQIYAAGSIYNSDSTIQLRVLAPLNQLRKESQSEENVADALEKLVYEAVREI